MGGLIWDYGKTKCVVLQPIFPFLQVFFLETTHLRFLSELHQVQRIKATLVEFKLEGIIITKSF